MEFRFNNVKFAGYALLRVVFSSVLDLDLSNMDFWLIMLGILLISWERKQ